MENQTDTPTLTIEERVATLENQIKILIDKQSKPRSSTAKILTDEEQEAKRLKINEASRISKLKSRAAAIGMTVEEYQTYQANKKAGLKPGWVDPGDMETTIVLEESITTERISEASDTEQKTFELESQSEITPELKKGKGKNKR